MIEFQNRHIKLPDGSPVVVCRIKGSIDGATLVQFEEKLLGFLDQGVKFLIIVFSQVHYINSTGMGVLVKLADKFQEVGGEFNLVDVPDKMVALFNMLGLLALIKLSKNEEEALKAFQAKLSVNKNVAAKTVVRPEAPSFSARQASPNVGANSALRNAVQNVRQQGESPVPRQNETKTLPKDPAPKKQERKLYVVTCKKCSRKISLGPSLKEGTYKCPCCMVMFKVSTTGRIEYIS